MTLYTPIPPAQTTTTVVQIDDGQQCSVGSTDCVPCALAPLFMAIVSIVIFSIVGLRIWQSTRQKDKAAKKMERPFDLEKK